jgi:hypothetical protein
MPQSGVQLNPGAEDITVSELLTARPPTIYFLNGQTVRGGTVFDSRTVARTLPPNMIMSVDWPGVDIRAETRASAASRGLGRSIHESLEEYLRSQRRRAKHRWILGNDGSGEMADYLVLEVGHGRVFLDLWHAKFAHGNAPCIRVTDFQEVVAQAIKSRRWLTDAGFWAELLARMTGRSTPRVTVIEGSERLLRVVCGAELRFAHLSYDRLRPIISGKVGIAQPGLSHQLLEAALTLPPPPSFTADQLQSATQIRDLLGVLHDAVAGVHDVLVIGST